MDARIPGKVVQGSTGAVVMKNCPVCGTPEHVRCSRSKGSFEKKFLRQLFIHAFRCRKCRSRFFRFSLKPQRVRRSTLNDNFQKTDLPMPDSGESFEKVVEEIRRAEQELTASKEASPAKKVRTYSRVG